MTCLNIDSCHVSIIDMEMYAHHGVLDVERKVGNTFRVKLTLYYNAFPAMESDNIDDALNYAVAADIVAHEMSIPSNLLEGVAFRIIKALTLAFDTKISNGTLTITKGAPPLPYNTAGTSFTVDFTIKPDRGHADTDS